MEYIFDFPYFEASFIKTSLLVVNTVLIYQDAPTNGASHEEHKANLSLMHIRNASPSQYLINMFIPAYSRYMPLLKCIENDTQYSDNERQQVFKYALHLTLADLVQTQFSRHTGIITQLTLASGSSTIEPSVLSRTGTQFEAQLNAIRLRYASGGIFSSDGGERYISWSNVT